MPPPVIQSNTEAEKQLIREVRRRGGGRKAGRWGPAGENLPNEIILPPPSPWGWYHSLLFGAQRAEAQGGAVTRPRSRS